MGHTAEVTTGSRQGEGGGGTEGSGERQASVCLLRVLFGDGLVVSESV